VKKAYLGDSRGHWQTVHDICISDDGQSLATCANDTTAKVWNLQGGVPYVTVGNVRSPAEPYTGHDTPIRAVCFSRNGEYLATGGDDGQVILWNLVEQMRACTCQGHAKGITWMGFSYDSGGHLATASLDGNVFIWDLFASLSEA
jgi:WD40 repeat protein